jgi:hypothetical protein
MQLVGDYADKEDREIVAFRRWKLGEVVAVWNSKGNFADLDFQLEDRTFTARTSISSTQMQLGEHYRVYYDPKDPSRNYVDLSQLHFNPEDRPQTTTGSVDAADSFSFRYHYVVNGSRLERWQSQDSTAVMEEGAYCTVTYFELNPQASFLSVHSCR